MLQSIRRLCPDPQQAHLLLRYTLLPLFLLVATALPAQAQLVTYDVAGATTNQTSLSPSTASGVSATDLVRSGGITKESFWDGTTNNFGASQWPTSDTRDGSKYFSFTVSPTGGNAMDLSQLEFALSREPTYTGDPEFNGPRKAAVTYIVGSGTEQVLTTDLDLTNSADSNLDFIQTNFSLDLSSIPNTTETVEFRFYLYDRPTDAEVGGTNSAGAIGILANGVDGTTAKANGPYIWKTAGSASRGSNVIVSGSTVQANTDPTIATNTGSTVNEGADDTITQSELEATDPEEGASNLTYTIDTDVSEGELYNIFTSTQLNTGDTFTQEDLNDGLIEYQHDGSEPASESFDFTVSDGQGGSASGTFSITVNPVNDAPTLTTNNGLTLDEGATASIGTSDLSASDVDDMASNLTYTVTSGPSNGTLLVNSAAATSFTQQDLADGAVEYQHDGSETTADSFTFDLTDDDGAGPTGETFSITINPVNDAPTLTTNDGLTLNEGATASIGTGNLSATDNDDTAGNLTYTITSGSSNGTLLVNSAAATSFTQQDLADGAVEYQHDGSETTADSFTFDLTDDDGAGPTGETFSITISPVNNAPTLTTNNGLTLNEGATAPIGTSDLSASDVDDTASNLTYAITSGPSNGTLLVNSTAATSFTQQDLADGAVEYQHDGSETTADSFKFDLTDDDGAGPTGETFSITVNPVNNAPTLTTNDGLTLNEGATASIGTGELGATDNDDPAGNLTYTVTSGPSNGTLLVNSTAATSFTQQDLADGAVEYQHDGSETTADSFTFDLTDDDGAGPTGETFSITINPVNDASTLTTNDGLTLNEGATASIGTGNLSATDNDDTAGNLTYTVTSGPSNGTLLVNSAAAASFTQQDLADGVVEYQHDGSETTADSFTFDLTDDDGAGPTGETFSITISPVNNAPTISAISDQTIEEDATLSPVSFTVSDAETSASSLTVTATSDDQTLVPDANITLGGSDGNRTIEVSPASNESGTATITVTVDDTSGEPNATASTGFVLTVTAVPDLSITDGSPQGLDFTASASPGADNNPVGILALSADQAGASFEELTATNLAPGVSGISAARLFWSDDTTLEPGTDTELASVAVDDQSAPSTILFDGFSEPVSTTTGYAILAIDVEPGASDGGVQFELSQPANLTVTGSEIATVNGNSATSFAALPLSNDATALPVEFAGINVQRRTAQGIILEWETLSELNNAGFDVQRTEGGTEAAPQSDASSWTTLATVEGAGTTDEAQSYAFTDTAPPYAADSLTYRLRQLDADGTASFSEAVTVALQTMQPELLPAYPNPTRGQATIRFAVPEQQAVRLTLYDIMGRRVRVLMDKKVEGRTETPLRLDGLASGTYFLRMQTDGYTDTQRITVVR